MNRLKIICLFYFIFHTLGAFAQKQPLINWFEPTEGTAGDKVVVSVYNYSPNDTASKIYLNAFLCKVIKNADDHLVIVVPSGASSGAFKLKTRGGQTSSADPFKILFQKSQSPLASKYSSPAPVAPSNMATPTKPAVASGAPPVSAPAEQDGRLPNVGKEDKPLIIGFSPKSGHAGGVVKITGLNFGFTKSAVNVQLKNSAVFQVLSVYDGEIDAEIPQGAKDSGTLIVTVAGRKATSRDSFKIN